jgi:hypothetical protein
VRLPFEDLQRTIEEAAGSSFIIICLSVALFLGSVSFFQIRIQPAAFNH